MSKVTVLLDNGRGKLLGVFADGKILKAAKDRLREEGVEVSCISVTVDRLL